MSTMSEFGKKLAKTMMLKISCIFAVLLGSFFSSLANYALFLFDENNLDETVLTAIDNRVPRASEGQNHKLGVRSHGPEAWSTDLNRESIYHVLQNCPDFFFAPLATLKLLHLAKFSFFSFFLGADCSIVCLTEAALSLGDWFTISVSVLLPLHA